MQGMEIKNNESIEILYGPTCSVAVLVQSWMLFATQGDHLLRWIDPERYSGNIRAKSLRYE